MGGDSGSLVLDEEHFAIGVVFAGTTNSAEKVTYVIGIRPFLDALDAQLICGGTNIAPEYHPA